MQYNLFENTPVEIKAISKKQLCTAYGIHRITLAKWLSNIPELGNHKKTRIFNPMQVLAIYKHLGQP